MESRKTMAKTRREQEINDLDALDVAIQELSHHPTRWGENWIVPNARQALARISQRLRDSVPLGPADPR